MSEKLREILQAADVVRHDPVKLRSGKSSDFYIDIKKGFGDPELLRVISQELARKLDSKTTAVAATGHGGVPIAVGVALETGLPLILIRERIKDHGMRNLIDGYQPGRGDFVAIVDDVFTTGSSLRETIDALGDSGAEIVGCYVVVKRGDGDVSAPLTYLLEPEDIT